MISSWEIEGFDNPDLYYDLAISYLDGSIELTKKILDGSFPNTFSHSRVVLSLAYHASELFLKAALFRKTGEKSHATHNVIDLYKKYKKHYPDSCFSLEVPFRLECAGLNKDDIRKEESLFDQKFRYHSDTNGDRWKGYGKMEGIYAFLPKQFLEDLILLQQQFRHIGNRYILRT